MPHESPEEHRTFRFFSFSLLLFGVFVLFLILMLLFSARIYQQTVKQTDSDSGLGTAATYLTTKFRQHDRGDEIFPVPWMIFRLFVSGRYQRKRIYHVYLPKNDSLMELFTAKGSQASSDAGTVISQLSNFRFSEMENGFTTFPWKVPQGSARNSCFIALPKRRHHEKIKT